MKDDTACVCVHGTLSAPSSARCLPYNSETRQFYDVKYDPFLSGEKNPPVLAKE